jgi:hypothetical protein
VGEQLEIMFSCKNKGMHCQFSGTIVDCIDCCCCQALLYWLLIAPLQCWFIDAAVGTKVGEFTNLSAQPKTYKISQSGSLAHNSTLAISKLILTWLC